jgi:ketosteroid isomerase-like protein
MKRSPEIEKSSRDVEAAFERGDFAFVEQATSREPGCVSIGSDADEYIRDYEQIISSLRESTPDIHFRIGEFRAYEHGDVGWGDGTGTFERDGESVPVRVTVVLLREGGQWRAIQSHSSIGVPNDRMFDSMFRRPDTTTQP